MSTNEKLAQRFRQRKKDLTWQDLERFLGSHGFKPDTPGGGSSGSHGFRFMIPERPETAFVIAKPHNPPRLRDWHVKKVLSHLDNLGLLAPE